MITVNSELVDWRKFLLVTSLPWPIPLEEELLDTLQRFKAVDEEQTGAVTYEQYMQVLATPVALIPDHSHLRGRGDRALSQGGAGRGQSADCRGGREQEVCRMHRRKSSFMRSVRKERERNPIAGKGQPCSLPACHPVPLLPTSSRCWQTPRCPRL